MFKIYIDSEGSGNIQIGDWSEQFSVDLFFEQEENFCKMSKRRKRFVEPQKEWRKRGKEYCEDLWKKELTNFIYEKADVCILYKQNGPPRYSNFWAGWVLMRVGEDIVVTDELFFFTPILKLKIMLNIYDFKGVKEYFSLQCKRGKGLNDEEISEWIINEESIKAFLQDTCVRN